jgi:hypothetical protein
VKPTSNLEKVTGAVRELPAIRKIIGEQETLAAERATLAEQREQMKLDAAHLLGLDEIVLEENRRIMALSREINALDAKLAELDGQFATLVETDRAKLVAAETKKITEGRAALLPAVDQIEAVIASLIRHTQGRQFLETFPKPSVQRKVGFRHIPLGNGESLPLDVVFATLREWAQQSEAPERSDETVSQRVPVAA